MLWNRLLYDVLGGLYAVSLMLFFMDAIQPRRKINRTALLLLFLVFLCETFFLLARLREFGYVPVYSRFDALLLISWLILLIALVVDTFFRVDLLLFFVNVLGFAFVLFDAFARQGQLLYVANQGDLLILHISLAIISYALLSFSFVFSAMYLIQDKFLREKRWNRWYLRLPSLERLDTYAFRAVVGAVPLLLLSMILGVIWGKLTLDRFGFGDPKTIATMALWVMYGTYLIFRLRSGWGGKTLVWYNICCFVGVLINFAIVGNYSIFHHGS